MKYDFVKEEDILLGLDSLMDCGLHVASIDFAKYAGQDDKVFDSIPENRLYTGEKLAFIPDRY